MALLDDEGRGVLIGIGIGVGFAALLPFLKPVLRDAGRPLLKATIKAGILAYERGRETAAKLAESFDDILAEVRAENAQAPAPSVPKANGGV